MGFGLSIDGNSSAEIDFQFYNEYNKEPLDPQAYLSQQEVQKLPPPIKETLTWEAFQRESSKDDRGVSGRLVLKVLRPRFDRLEQLKNTSPEQIRKLIASWR